MGIFRGNCIRASAMGTRGQAGGQSVAILNAVLYIYFSSNLHGKKHAKKCFPGWRPVPTHLVEVGVVGPTVLREEANPVAREKGTMYAETAARGGGEESETWMEGN